MSTSPDPTDPPPPEPPIVLPPCVHDVRRAADKLHATVVETFFPILAPVPSSPAEVKKLILDASRWALAVDAAYGPGAETSLLGHFATRETDVVSVHPVEALFDQRDVENAQHEFERVARGRASPTLRLIEPRWPRLFKIARSDHRPSFMHAADVLGPVPGEFAHSLLGVFPHRVRGLQLDRGVEPTVSSDVAGRDSRAIYSDIHAAHVTVMAKALGLVQWVRDRIRALEHALIPVIEETPSRKVRTRHVHVSQAGMVRDQEITAGQRNFLYMLRQKEKADVLRKQLDDLFARIPELRPWIQRLGRHPEDENRVLCSAPTELRTRLRIERSKTCAR